MDEDMILSIVKQRLGISSTVRDEYLKHIILAALDNLEKVRAIVLDPERADHVFFVVKYVVWEYQSKTHTGSERMPSGTANLGMPAWLRLELNNLMMKSGGKNGNIR